MAIFDFQRGSEDIDLQIWPYASPYYHLRIHQPRIKTYHKYNLFTLAFYESCYYETGGSLFFRVTASESKPESSEDVFVRGI